MIIFDASYLVIYLHPNPKPAKDRNNKPVSQFRERVNYLIASLNMPGKIIGVPTPALAEVLVRAGNSRPEYIRVLTDTYRFELLPFSVRAAIEASELIEKIKAENRGQPVATWAKIKFDIQIAAIGKAETATQIYSDDEDIERLGKRLKIPVIRICDLPLPPPPDEYEIAQGDESEDQPLLRGLANPQTEPETE
jgi:predicted nucleic acid-binding protein